MLSNQMAWDLMLFAYGTICALAVVWGFSR